jgi:hypothetical protein
MLHAETGQTAGWIFQDTTWVGEECDISAPVGLDQSSAAASENRLGFRGVESNGLSVAAKQIADDYSALIRERVVLGPRAEDMKPFRA